jgi:hypothetical protein
VNAQVSEAGVDEPRAFATTRWSLILSANASESGEQAGQAGEATNRDALAPGLIGRESQQNLILNLILMLINWVLGGFAIRSFYL